MRKVKVSPSLLSANFASLMDDLKKVEKSCEIIHLDVMDGVFVPNISFGIPVIKSIRKVTNLFFDTHLMITHPIRYIEDFSKAGADLITFHYEACDDYDEICATINKIRSCFKKVGVSLKPNTDVNEIINLLKNHEIDLILVMSVEPGFGGQKFIESSLEKIKILRKYIDDNNLKTMIEVDGGINGETAKLIVTSGADILVSGSYLFSNEDFDAAVKSLL